QAAGAALEVPAPEGTGVAASPAPEAGELQQTEPGASDEAGAGVVSSSGPAREDATRQESCAVPVQPAAQGEGMQDVSALSVSPGLPVAFTQVQNQPKAPR